MKCFVVLMLLFSFCFPSFSILPNKERTLPFMPFDKNFPYWVQALDLAVTNESHDHLLEKLQDEAEAILSSYPSITNLHEAGLEEPEELYASELDSRAVPIPTRRLLSPLYEVSEEASEEA